MRSCPSLWLSVVFCLQELRKTTGTSFGMVGVRLRFEPITIECELKALPLEPKLLGCRHIICNVFISAATGRQSQWAEHAELQITYLWNKRSCFKLSTHIRPLPCSLVMMHLLRNSWMDFDSVWAVEYVNFYPTMPNTGSGITRRNCLRYFSFSHLTSYKSRIMLASIMSILMT
jgi:hypothetical protein